MSEANRQWQDIKANYLKAIEKCLADIDHPQRQEILTNVSEHLDNKYAELSPAQQNWEGYQQIITEMGPPQEYAELLMEEKSPTAARPSGTNTLLAVMFVIVLMIVGGYLIYNAKNTPVTPASQNIPGVQFEPDGRVLGKWATIDFVKRIDDFDPTRKNWSGRLYLLSLEFQDNGQVKWQAENREPTMLEWTKGQVRPFDKRPSFYYLRNIDGQTYLFYEWVSGDVTVRGREPAYYVLKQVKDGETVVPGWFENDPQVLGYWVSVDFVKNSGDFQPGIQHTTDLFVKTLAFEKYGRLRWTIGESKPIALDWTKGKIRPFGVWPAAYSIKPFDGVDYLFYEYRTRDENPAGYYVFKQSERHENAEEAQDIPFENDSQMLGQWTTVDFVATPDAFKANQQSWQGTLFVKGLNFKDRGMVEWCLGEDHMKIKHRWTKGLLNPDDELPSRYFIERYNDGDYLFMEWNSGDVTIRGQKPLYYVLKKAE